MSFELLGFMNVCLTTSEIDRGLISHGSITMSMARILEIILKKNFHKRDLLLLHKNLAVYETSSIEDRAGTWCMAV